MSKAFTREETSGGQEDAPHDEDEKESSPGKARYITPQGFRRLQDEMEQLWRVERPKITAEVSAAAAQGDRSENAEYIYGKKKLREIDRRIRFLSKRLDSLTVVETTKTDRVYFGAYVTVEEEEGRETTYRIVGPDEFDIKKGCISVDSPLAKALLNRAEGDETTLVRPKGPVELVISKIRY